MVEEHTELIKIKKENKKIPKEVSQEILKGIFKNLLGAILIMLYFVILNIAYTAMKEERLVNDLKVFATAFLVSGIVVIERAYKKESGKLALTGAELLFLSIHTLSIMHIITLFKYDFRLYLLTSSYIIAIYYVLKSIILYTMGRYNYAKDLNDISDIIKKDEPVVKEAKRSVIEDDDYEDEENSLIGDLEKDLKKKKANRTKPKSKPKTKATSTTTRKKKEAVEEEKPEKEAKIKKEVKPKAKSTTTKKESKAKKTATTKKAVATAKVATANKTATTKKKEESKTDKKDSEVSKKTTRTKKTTSKDEKEQKPKTRTKKEAVKEKKENTEKVVEKPKSKTRKTKKEVE